MPWEDGTEEPPVEVGDYYARIERPSGGGFAAGRAIAVEYHLQKALVSIAAEDRQQFRYDGLPKPVAVSADSPGEYRARISFGGNANYLGASKDVAFPIR